MTSGIRQGVLNHNSLTTGRESVRPPDLRSTPSPVNTAAPRACKPCSPRDQEPTSSMAPLRITLTTRECTRRSTLSGIPMRRSTPIANFDYTVGSPIIPNKGFFFYFAVEPLRSSSSAGGTVTFADPAFTTWAQANPGTAGTVGTGLLQTYTPPNVTVTNVENADAYFALPGGGSLCATAASRLHSGRRRLCRIPVRLAAPRSATEHSISAVSTRSLRTIVFTPVSSGRCCKLVRPRPCRNSPH